MKKSTMRFISVLVCMMMLLPLTACKKTAKQVVPEDTYPHIYNDEAYMQWWDDNDVEAIPAGMKNEFVAEGGAPDGTNVSIQVQIDLVTVQNDTVFLQYIGYRTSDQAYVNSLTGFGIGVENSGQQVINIDLVASFDPEKEIPRKVVSVHNENGKWKVLLGVQKVDEVNDFPYEYELDTSSGKLINGRLIDPSQAVGSYLSVMKTICMNGKYYFFGNIQGGSLAGQPAVVVGDNDQYTLIRTEGIEFVADCGKYDDKHIVFVGGSQGTRTMYLINTETDSLDGTVNCPEEYLTSWHKMVDGFGFVSVENRKVSCWSFSDHSEKTMLDMNYTGLSYEESQNVELIAGTEDKVILLNYVDSWCPHIHILTKSTDNPHIGKRVIKCAFLEGITPLQSDAIAAFNSTSTQYYAIIIEDYKYWNIVDEEAAMEDWFREHNRAKSEMINKLMSDIRSGKGPDILLDGAQYIELQSQQFLVNLAPRIDELKLSSKEYFTHVCDLSNRNGCTFYVPLEFYINGLLVDADKVGKEKGVKFSDYPAFLDTHFNSFDPIIEKGMTNQTGYLDELLNTDFAICIDENGKYNFDTPAFRGMAEYVKNHVPEQIAYTGESWLANALSLDGKSIAKGKTMVGYPSSDGHGASIRLYSAAAVAACSSCQDGAWELIVSMLQENNQKKAMGIPLNRNAFNAKGLNDESVKKYEEIIEGCDNIVATDYTVINIINEEIPAYFYGQKSLDDVIAIINNRVKVLQDERG